jgi:iron complex outermembrane receptor protein
MKFQLILLFLLPFFLRAQTSTDSTKTIELPTFFIKETKPTFQTTSRNIISMTQSEMKETGGGTLSDAISRLPGISQLTTGGISKPVIRGLYGNRLQVNIAGLRLEDQQWEDEHGLGLSQIGVERVELIKGPSALLFGSDAMAGVINIVDEKFEPYTSKQHLNQSNKLHNFNLSLFSNTYGISSSYGFKYRTPKNNEWILRTGLDSHADYSDGKGNRAPNTRYAMYNFKLSHNINKSKFHSENKIFVGFNQFGFVKDTLDFAKILSEERTERGFEEEHHQVFYGIISSSNTLKLNENTNWHSTIGLQSNQRQEVEGEEDAEFSLNLNTVNLKTDIEKKLSNNVLLINGIASMFQTNTNMGERIVVPDAKIFDLSAFSYLNKMWEINQSRIYMEAGLRYDRRNVTTLITEELNKPNSNLPAFSKAYDALNGSLGMSWVKKNLVLKTDLATGYRAPNLAELSSNGRHEGTNRWDLGNPNFKTEQCFNIDISSQYTLGYWLLRGSVFNNNFKNYIYISPTKDLLNGVPLYKYLQTNATLNGFETGLEFNMENKLTASVDYSLLNAKKSSGEYLPLMPANSLLTKAKIYIPLKNENFQDTYFTLNLTRVSSQNNIYKDELPTKNYLLIGANIGTTYKKIRVGLVGNNLTNSFYYNHLSQLKKLGIRDMGRNVVLNFSWQF